MCSHYAQPLKNKSLKMKHSELVDACLDFVYQHLYPHPTINKIKHKSKSCCNNIHAAIDHILTQNAHFEMLDYLLIHL